MYIIGMTALFFCVCFIQGTAMNIFCCFSITEPISFYMKESQLCTIKGQLHNARKNTKWMNIRTGVWYSFLIIHFTTFITAWTGNSKSTHMSLKANTWNAMNVLPIDGKISWRLASDIISSLSLYNWIKQNIHTW